MNILPGDLFWISPNGTNQIASDHRHPHVVLQYGTSNFVTVCRLTSNLKRAKEPGNVLLDEGEGSLSRRSVVVVSHVSIVHAAQLGEYIGRLTEQRVRQVLAGLRLLQHMMQHHE